MAVCVFLFIFAKMDIDPTYIYGSATSVYIAVCVACAAVKWFHMCHPYDRNPDYFYPGRAYVALLMLNAIVLAPYALNPDSPDAWYLTRFYLLPVVLHHFAVLIFSYFGTIMSWKKWRIPSLVISSPVILSMLITLVLAIIPGDQVGSVVPWLPDVLLFGMGVIGTAICVAAMSLVYAWAKRFASDDFSNSEDFPVAMAQKWSVLTFFNIVMCWAGALVGSKGLTAVIMLLMSTSAIVLVISSLHPHRLQPTGVDKSKAPAKPAARRSSTRKKQDILSAVDAVVVGQKAYLDAHLTIQDVADRSGYSRSTLSSLFKAEMGGFFAYINRLRLQHVETYQLEHPGATIQEAILESGFNSRQAYYSVKAKLGAT